MYPRLYKNDQRLNNSLKAKTVNLLDGLNDQRLNNSLKAKTVNLLDGLNDHLQ